MAVSGRQGMKRHPIVRYKIQNLVSRYSLFSLILGYVLFTALLSLVLSAPYWNASDANILGWWFAEYQSLYSFGPPELITSAAPTSLRTVSLLLVTTTSVLAPAILLGAIVYKFFHVSHAVEFRSTAYVDRRNPSEPAVVVRFYNATPFPLTDVKTVLHIRSYEVEHGAVNVYNMRLFERDWFYGPAGVPFSVSAPLEPTDFREINGQTVLSSFMGHPLTGESWDLLAVVSGSAPNLSTGFTITKIYTPSELTQVVPGQIDLPRDLASKPRPSSWSGWTAFDEPQTPPSLPTPPVPPARS